MALYVGLLFAASATSTQAYRLVDFEILEKSKVQTSRKLSQEEEPLVSIADAKPIPFRWGGEEITNPEDDSFKYEQEISALLDSPLSDWAVLPEEIVGSSDFTIGLRPIDIKGQEPTQLVAYMEAELKMSGSRAFFDFLVTPEGQQAITAGDALKEAAARAAGLKSEGPNGAVVFTTAQSTGFGPDLTPIALVSTHWQTCGPNEQTYMAYPANVPIENRIPEVLAIAGPSAPEYYIVFAQRVRQIDDETVKVQIIQWGDLLPDILLPYPAPISWGLPVNFFSNQYASFADHFANFVYPANTGNECPAQCGVYGTNGDGSYGTEGVCV